MPLRDGRAALIRVYVVAHPSGLIFRMPEFRATIGLEAGARETFADMRRRGAWRDSASDEAYQGMVDRALGAGFGVEEA